jgi:hypothetical protein
MMVQHKVKHICTQQPTHSHRSMCNTFGFREQEEAKEERKKEFMLTEGPGINPNSRIPWRRNPPRLRRNLPLPEL